MLTRYTINGPVLLINASGPPASQVALQGLWFSNAVKRRAQAFLD
jgi:hypothetical protein